MKKIWLFIFSSCIALGIAVYSKMSPETYATKSNPTWKTFVKNDRLEISGHKTTPLEIEATHAATPKRSIAEENDQEVDAENEFLLHKNKIIKENHFQLREKRVLLGDIENANYQDERVKLHMSNKVNANWKDFLGNDLLRFQKDDTKLIIKDEFSIIRIQNDVGRYFEQVIITYVLKDGSNTSYRALVDSETGSVIETWDKTLNENNLKKRVKLTLPSDNNNGIIGK